MDIDARACVESSHGAGAPLSRRALLACLAAAAASTACGLRPPKPHQRFDAVVGPTAETAGLGPVFPDLASALAAAPRGGGQPFRIKLGPGHYAGKRVVERPNVHLYGDGATRTVLCHDDHAATLDARGEPLGTYASASLSVLAPGFRAYDLAIENRFDYRRALRLARSGGHPASGLQAVALRLDGDSDGALLQRVNVIGHQDSLLVDRGRSLFLDCTISGSVDFVFGAGRAWFERCQLVSRWRPIEAGLQGWICAPSTSLADAHGLVFARCTLRAGEGLSPRSVALGRPWRPTRQFEDGRRGDPDAVGAACFLECWMGAHVIEAGWTGMPYTGGDGQRIELGPEQARLREFGSRGPGASLHPGRSRLDAREANRLQPEDVVGAQLASALRAETLR